MRAILIEEFGGPEVLQEVDVPVPTPASDETLINVSRAGVNFADTHARADTYAFPMSLPLIPGMEVAGREEGTGRRVVALTQTGGYAEYVAAPRSATYPIPEGIEDETALALLIQGLTAWHLYRTAARAQEGDTVVVHAAAGGVGSLAVQLGRIFGVRRIIATASSPEKRELALSLGADVAVDPEPEGLKERLLEANDGRPVDVVFDMSGGAVFEASYQALAHYGRIVTYGIATMQPNSPSTSSLLRHSRTVAGFYLLHLMHDKAQFADVLQELFQLVLTGRLKVVTGRVYPLAEAAQAHIDLRSRSTTGKLTIDPTAR